MISTLLQVAGPVLINPLTSKATGDSIEKEGKD